MARNAAGVIHGLASRKRRGPLTVTRQDRRRVPVESSGDSRPRALEGPAFTLNNAIRARVSMTIRQLAVAISVPACLVQVSCEMEQKLRPPSASERLRFLNAMKRGVADACTKRASGRNPRRTPADSRTAGAVGESSSSGPSMFSRNRRFRSLPPAACYVAVVAFGSDLIGSAQLRHKFD